MQQRLASHIQQPPPSVIPHSLIPLPAILVVVSGAAAADIAAADTVAAVIDSNADISAHPFIISLFNLADNINKSSRIAC